MSPSGDLQVTIINDTDISNADIERALDGQDHNVAQLMRWAQDLQPRNGGTTQRDRYLASNSLFSQFNIARYAVETDNVVSGIADTTEQLAFNEVRIECDDQDEEDVWNQVADKIGLVNRMQEIWREVFTYSNSVVAAKYSRSNYTPEGKTEAGNKRRKVFKQLHMPSSLAVMDITRVIPVGDFLFGDEQLVYLADTAQISKLKNPANDDSAVQELILGPYKSTPSEREQIVRETGATLTPNNMFLLNPSRVFRITATRAPHDRYAHLRMLSIFELLDLKQQLRQMDRALLIGGTQFILLVKKGAKDEPPTAGELQALSGQLRSMARIPVIVDDHRLSIEIITPKTDNVLAAEKHRLLDSMIAIRLFQIFQQAGNSRESGDDSTKLIRVVARSMEARRKVIRDEIQKNVLLPTFLANDDLKEMPRIKFYPERISLDFDPNIITTYLDLRQMNQISMQSLLAQFDLDAEDEYNKMVQEFADYSDIISPTPPSAPAGPAKRAGGRKGGNNSGGGANRQSMKSGPPRGPGKPNVPDRKKP